MTSTLTHLNEKGEANMVDISEKSITKRTATAMSRVLMAADVLDKVSAGQLAKGDVFAVARIAGIQAAKKCSDLIPLCHPLALSGVEIDCEIDRHKCSINIYATCKITGKTGVEMEALTAASVAALTIYDMCKALDKGIVIAETRLLEKTGGKSGNWITSEPGKTT